MTREEKLELCEYGCEQTVHEIYDDFESRTCDNCKHGGDNYYTGDCPIDDEIWASGTLPITFGCGYFKKGV